MTQEQTRRYNATLEAAIRFAKVTAQYGQTAKVRKEAAARLAELEAMAAHRSDPDDYPGGPRVDGMTPHRAAIVEAWGNNR